MLTRATIEIKVLVDEMLDKLPKEIWVSDTSTFLDPAMGGGQFVIEIERRLHEVGHSDENISSRVFGYEKNILVVNTVVSKNKLLGQYSVADFLSKETNMKFDVVVGNPPFQDGNRKDEASKLWPQFVKNSYEISADNGFIAMICPNNWMQPTADIGKGDSKKSVNIFSDIFKKNNLLYANIDSNNLQKTFFQGVGSTFSYFILQRCAYTGSTTLLTEQGEIVIDISEIDCLPKITTQHSLSIMKKMTGVPFSFIDQNHRLNGDEQPEQTDEFKYKIFHTNKKNGTFWFGKKMSQYMNKPKVLISLSGIYKPIYDDSNGFSNMCLALPCSTKSEAEHAVVVLSSKLYKFWVEMQKFSGFNPRKTILQLPAVNLNKLWSDEDIFKEFGLTQDEIDYISENTK